MSVEGGTPYRQMLANRVSARQSAKRKRELAFSSPAPTKATVTSRRNTATGLQGLMSKPSRPDMIESLATIGGAYASKAVRKVFPYAFSPISPGLGKTIRDMVLPEYSSADVRDMTPEERKEASTDVFSFIPGVGSVTDVKRVEEKEGVTSPWTIGSAGVVAADITPGNIFSTVAAGGLRKLKMTPDTVATLSSRRRGSGVGTPTGPGKNVPDRVGATETVNVDEGRAIPYEDLLPGESPGTIIPFRQADEIDEIKQPRNITEAIDQMPIMAPSARGANRDQLFNEGYEFVIESDEDVASVTRALFGREDVTPEEAAYIQKGVTVRIRPGKNSEEVRKQANDVIWGRSVERVKESSKITKGKYKGRDPLELLGVKLKRDNVDLFTDDEAYDLVTSMKGDMGISDVQIDFVPVSARRTPKGGEVVRTGVEHWDHTISPTDYSYWVRDSVTDLIDQYGSLTKARKSPEWKALQKDAEDMGYIVFSKNNVSPMPGTTNIVIGAGERGTTSFGQTTPIISTPVSEQLMRVRNFVDSGAPPEGGWGAGPYAERVRSDIWPHMQTFMGSSFHEYILKNREAAIQRARRRQGQFLQPLIGEYSPKRAE